MEVSLKIVMSVVAGISVILVLALIVNSQANGALNFLEGML